MIDRIVLTQHGVREDDLKPAFLMLSGCETDLWKLTRSSDTAGVALQHYENAKKWLQKVYGDASSAPQSSNNVNLESAHRNRHFNAPPSGPRSHRPPAVPLAPDRPLDPALQTLRREIQSLRDQLARQDALLKQTHADKCKAEEELAREHSLRRKLERKLDEAEDAVHLARRMEGYAVDEMKREVEQRKRAEERVQAERERRRAAEKSVETMAIKPLFESLAGMFQKAAQEGLPLACADENLPPPLPPRL
jgi:hypothetical protein